MIDGLTPRQQEILALVQSGMSHRQIAEKLDVGRGTISGTMRAVKIKAMQEGADPGYFVTGKSTLYDADGEKKIEWVKTAKDKETLEQLQEAFKAAVDDCKPLAKITAPRKASKDSMVVIPLGDPHIGLYAYRKMSGEDFDCDIAERDLFAAADHLMMVAPQTEDLLIANLGDFYHGDSNRNQTTAGTYVHMDTRFIRVMQVGLAVMIRIIRRGLEKYKKVTVVNATGNHDEHTSTYLTIALMQAFNNNPRVTIRDPADFHYYEFHKNLIGITHGNNVSPRDLPGVMANDMPEAWARAVHRYWLIGHVHHRSKILDEPTGATVESFRTLAAKDEWHFKKGYRAGRDMNAIVYHKEYGETDRHRCDILRARA